MLVTIPHLYVLEPSGSLASVSPGSRPESARTAKCRDVLCHKCAVRSELLGDLSFLIFLGGHTIVAVQRDLMVLYFLINCYVYAS